MTRNAGREHKPGYHHRAKTSPTTQYLKYLEIDKTIADKVNAGIIILPAHNNVYGSFIMGAHPEVLPGGLSSIQRSNIDTLEIFWDKSIPDYVENDVWLNPHGDSQPDVLYLIGEK